MNKYFLDKRVLVNGKKSQIHLDNFIQLGLLPPGGLQGQVLTKLTDEDYDVYWEDVNTLITSTINPITINNTLFVKTNGNNSTAQIAKLDLAWADPLAAIGAATDDQTVFVFPGTYTMTPGAADRLIKNKVTLYLCPGVTLLFTIDNVNRFNTLFYSPYSGNEAYYKILGSGDIIFQSVTNTPNNYFKINGNPFNAVESYSFIFESNALIFDECAGFLIIRDQLNGFGSNVGEFFFDVRWVEAYSGVFSLQKNFLSTSEGKCVLDINIDKVITRDNSLVPIFDIRHINQGSVSIRINDIEAGRLESTSLGYIYLSRNSDNVRMNIDVKSFEALRYNTSNSTGMLRPIIMSDMDKSYKNIDIKFNSIYTLYDVMDMSADSVREFGEIKFTGVIRESVLGQFITPKVDGLINFGQDNQYLIFNLNVEIEDNLNSIGLNLTNGQFQKITGRIAEKYPNPGGSPRSGFLEYGNYGYLAPVAPVRMTLPVLNDLVIVCDDKFVIYRNSLTNSSLVKMFNVKGATSIDPAALIAPAPANQFYSSSYII